MANEVDASSITLGIEEELFLIDPSSFDLLADPPMEIYDECERTRGPHKVVREFLRSQIETNTKVCHSIKELRHAVFECRKIVVDAAARHGAVVSAISTHPFASWRDQSPTPGERYERFEVTFQEGVRRFVIGGMHVHAGFGDAESRIRVMTAVRRFLPLLHALSTSSPFYGGHETGFKSYRLSLYGGIPRTGIPNPLSSRKEFERLIDEYKTKKFIDTESELWWDIRPSGSYPTVELRICDVCTRVEDAICIAAIYACLVRWLERLDRQNRLPPEPLTEIIAEERWIAQRYGVFSFFGDLDSDTGRVDIQDHLASLLQELAEDADALDCVEEIQQALDIVKNGTGADRQIDLYRLRMLDGDSPEDALRHVVEDTIRETAEGPVA